MFWNNVLESHVFAAEESKDALFFLGIPIDFIDWVEFLFVFTLIKHSHFYQSYIKAPLLLAYIFRIRRSVNHTYVTLITIFLNHPTTTIVHQNTLALNHIPLRIRKKKNAGRIIIIFLNSTAEYDNIFLKKSIPGATVLFLSYG